MTIKSEPQLLVYSLGDTVLAHFEDESIPPPYESTCKHLKPTKMSVEDYLLWRYKTHTGGLDG